MKETIFVHIAAYRDPEIRSTCLDLISKATHPERIFIGIIWQGAGPDDDFMISYTEKLPQVTVKKYDISESKGACWARSKGQKLYQGEDYALQIDSHMRFEQGWDEVLINMLSQCDSEKPLLTTYPPAYTQPTILTKTHIFTIKPNKFTSDAIVTFTSSGIPVDKAPDTPIKGVCCSAGFIFGKGDYMKEVPYDPSLYFFGEEISMTVRLWTSGWDFYHPNRLVIYHLWSRGGRRTYSQDHDDSWWALDRISKERVASILGTGDAYSDLGIFGLGTKRSLQDYEQFSGIDFNHKKINPTTRDIFTKIYMNYGWGSSESRSGPGSTLEQTENIRSEIKKLIAKYNIKSITDFGCGDLNWIHLLFDEIEQYTGCDIVQESIQTNSRKFPKYQFKCLDLAKDEIPQSDLLIVREVIGHQPLETGVEILENIRKSKCKYLLSTTWARKTSSGFDVPNEVYGSNADGNPLTNKNIEMGGWYPVNLMNSPFSLPLAREFLQEEATGKTLGFWEIAALRK